MDYSRDRAVKKIRTVNDQMGRNTDKTAGWAGDEVKKLREDSRNTRKNDERFLNGKYTEEYRYFDNKNLMKRLTYSEYDMDEARELLEKSTDVRLSVKIGCYERRNDARGKQSRDDREQVGTAEIRGVEPRRAYGLWRATVVFERDGIVRGTCMDWICSSYAGGKIACKHVLACALKLKEYLDNNNIGDATDASGMRLLGYVDKKSTGSDRPQKQLKIEPLISDDKYDPRKRLISFKAGVDRLYIIKDITTFVECVEEKKNYTFGKSGTLRLSRDRFDEESLGWLDFMTEADKELKKSVSLSSRFSVGGRRESYFGSEPRYILGKDLELEGTYLDLLFDMQMGKKVAYKRSGSNIVDYVEICEKPLPLKFSLKKSTDLKTKEFRGVILEGTAPSSIGTEKHSYYFDENCFARVRSEDSGLLNSLLDEAVDGTISVLIGRNHLKDFYDHTLPAIKRVAEVEECNREDIESYIPPEPEFAFFLDAYEGMVVCDADVYYGAASFSLTDPENGFSKKANGGLRNAEKENVVINWLREYFPYNDERTDIFCCDKNDEAVFAFLDHGIDDLFEFGEVFSTDRFKRLTIRKNVKFSLGVSVESSIMDLEISSDLSREDLLEIFNGYKKKRKFVKLSNGDFLKLDKDSEALGLSEMMDDMGVSPEEFVKGKMHIPAYRALYLNKMLEKLQGVYAERDRTFKNLIREFDSIGNSDYEVPAEFKGLLRNYQELGYKWLRTLDHYGFGGILADDMGLGKTLQVISVIKALKDEEKNTEKKNVVLVVCPASLVYNWGEELKKYAPELVYRLVLGTKPERNRILREWENADVLVTSYDLLKRDIDSYSGKNFRLQVIDEAQYIKNHNTDAAKTVKLISSKTRFALTGTPIENRLSELWSIFDYLMPGILYKYDEFRSDFEMPIVKSDDKEASEQLRRMVQPFILRRLKDDVLKDLPEKLEEVRYAGMDDKQRNLYDAQVVRMKRKIEEKSDAQFAKSKIEILAELTRIRQICCDPSLCFDDYEGASAKREACIELVESLIGSGHRTLIFSQFTSMLGLLESDLKRKKIPFYKITGETSKESRMEMVKAFNEGDTPVFLISLKAGGTGLNLIGADAVIHYDPWWNVAAQNQATDRAHRIGQTKVVTVYKLILKNTIEEKIIKMQEQKKKLADDILSGESIASTSLSREDLLNLIE